MIEEIPQPTKRGRGAPRRRKDQNSRLDELAIQRRDQQFIDSLEKDNYHDDPHGDLVENKNAPKFRDTFDSKKEKKRRRSRNSEYYKYKYRRTSAQLIAKETKVNPDKRNFNELGAPPSKYPVLNICSVCGFQSNYKCSKCIGKFCSIPCQSIHKETRCFKWIS